jgi:hypothetical protein
MNLFVAGPDGRWLEANGGFSALCPWLEESPNSTEQCAG